MPKVLMQGKYILKPVLSGGEFVNKNRYISVRSVSEEVKSIKF